MCDQAEGTDDHFDSSTVTHLVEPGCCHLDSARLGICIICILIALPSMLRASGKSIEVLAINVSPEPCRHAGRLSFKDTVGIDDVCVGGRS